MLDVRYILRYNRENCKIYLTVFSPKEAKKTVETLSITKPRKNKTATVSESAKIENKRKRFFRWESLKRRFCLEVCRQKAKTKKKRSKENESIKINVKVLPKARNN